MKKYTLLILLSILLCISAVIMAQEIDEGFLGIKWKTVIGVLNGFIHISDHGPVAYYTNPNELHKLFEEEVPGVIYGFYKSELFAVFIKIESLEMFSKTRTQLTSKYGIPDKSFTARSEQTIYKWKSGDIKIKLKISEIEHTMKLVFYYTPLSNKVNEDALEAQQRKTPRLFSIKKSQVLNVVPLIELEPGNSDHP